jgi:hypothetical protein
MNDGSQIAFFRTDFLPTRSSRRDRPPRSAAAETSACRVGATPRLIAASFERFAEKERSGKSAVFSAILPFPTEHKKHYRTLRGFP